MALATPGLVIIRKSLLQTHKHKQRFNKYIECSCDSNQFDYLQLIILVQNAIAVIIRVLLVLQTVSIIILVAIRKTVAIVILVLYESNK